jgi:hypothetical protein
MLLPSSTSFSSRCRLVDERHDDTAVRRRCADHGDAREVEKRLHVVASRRKRLTRRYAAARGFPQLWQTPLSPAMTCGYLQIQYGIVGL